MNKLAEYLKKFSSIINSGSEKKKALIVEIKNHIGIELQKDCVEIKNNQAYIVCSPITKNTIFIKKRLILQSLEQRGFHISELR